VRPLDDNDLNGISTNDALLAAAHAWALGTPTAVTVIAGHGVVVCVTSPFAAPAALVAMKLDAIETRHGVGQDKRAGGAWDLCRILVGLDADATVRNALATGSSWSV
jgi:hypothetical protein